MREKRVAINGLLSRIEPAPLYPIPYYFTTDPNAFILFFFQTLIHIIYFGAHLFLGPYSVAYTAWAKNRP